MSTLNDARNRFKTLIDTYMNPSNILEDDDVTAANILTCWSGAKYPLSSVFFGSKNVDGVYAIGTPKVTAVTNYNGAIIGYREAVPVTIETVDKTGITGDFLRWRMERELRNIVETYWLGDETTQTLPSSYWSLETSAPTDKDMGGWTMHSVVCTVTYNRDVSPAYASGVSITYGHGYANHFTEPTYHETIYTATSNGEADGTTIINTAHTQANDYWNGYTVRILTGACAGETHIISDFDAASDTITLQGVGFSDQISADDTYQITRYSEVEDGQTLTVSVVEGDYLDLSVSATDGNAVGYVPITLPTQRSSTLYTTIKYRYMVTASATAKIELIFTSGTQTVLTGGAATTMTAGTATITTAKTITGIRLYNNTGAGHVYYDHILICKGDFTIPNFRGGFNVSAPTKNVEIDIPSMEGAVTQNLGSKPWTADCSCDLAFGNWKRSGDTVDGQAFLDIACNSSVEPFQWFTNASGENLSVTLSDLKLDRQATSAALNYGATFKLTEKRNSTGLAVDTATAIALETYNTRLGL